jgi:hypothetical protein
MNFSIIFYHLKKCYFLPTWPRKIKFSEGDCATGKRLVKKKKISFYTLCYKKLLYGHFENCKRLLKIYSNSIPSTLEFKSFSGTKVARAFVYRKNNEAQT